MPSEDFHVFFRDEDLFLSQFDFQFFLEVSKESAGLAGVLGHNLVNDNVIFKSQKTLSPTPKIRVWIIGQIPKLASQAVADGNQLFTSTGEPSM